MEQIDRTLLKEKNIALVAHDHCKSSLLEWVQNNREQLSLHKLFATGTTGNLINHHTGLHVTQMLSGPMGGDQQIGAMIAEKKIDIMIFFWDPLNAAEERGGLAFLGARDRSNADLEAAVLLSIAAGLKQC